LETIGVPKTIYELRKDELAMRTKLWMPLLALAFMVAVACAGCAAAPLGHADVRLTDKGFDPATVTVAKGGTVTWTSQTPASATVTSNDTSFDYVLQSKQSATRKFNTPGTFEYVDRYNPALTGEVVVR
jgi:plastocyanin